MTGGAALKGLDFPIVDKFLGLGALLLGLAWQTLSAPDAVIRPETAPGWSYTSLPLTDLWTFFHPSYHFPNLARMGNQGILHANPLPYLGTLAAGISLWKEKSSLRWLLPASLILAGSTAVFS